MEVCDDCRSDEVMYVDMDDLEHYCEDCFDMLDKSYIKDHAIKSVSTWMKSWYR